MLRTIPQRQQSRENREGAGTSSYQSLRLAITYETTPESSVESLVSTTYNGKTRRYGSALDSDSKASSPSQYECSYTILEYEVSRQDYGRLDYNAEIALRIHSQLPNADLNEPDIIRLNCFTFLVLIPKTSEYDALIESERVTDITKEWQVKEKEQRRWIVLFPKKDTPIEITKEENVLYLTENPVKNLNNNSDVCRFLTFSFENEIFAYAERALRYVQDRLAKKREHEQETLSFTNMEIRSLLTRKLPEHDTFASFTIPEESIENGELQRPSYRLLSEALQNISVQDCDIRGFCNTFDAFLVFVAELKQSADKTGVVDCIEKCLHELLKEKPQIVWVEKITTADLTAQGFKLTNTESKRWGTLGCFGKNADNSLVAITAGHCVETEQTVHIEINGTLEELGQCVQSHNSAEVDIAVININDCMEPRCTFQFCNEKDKVCKASVYQGAQIKNWPVHKKGAATQWTKGVVYCEEACVCNEKGIIINGNVNNIVFAEEGDSGAIVFFYDPNDIHNREVKLLSIVSKRVDVGGGAIPVGLSRKPTLTRSLKDGLDKVSNIKIKCND
ncbi:hypothetical protein KP79_PYT22047 [Mizuhopecten yessoensis]|uniref:Peptidase S1 domain-containing protein n=2 Tax=Mizuhopecten yessoensis TaxID=6573 RepID=A0A210PYY0_MIZYE|nr:hypothetical protein KP79_PYT22047 [Mizuhopecten yessoensis]